MAISASLQIFNSTSNNIKITGVSKVNDDATFAGIEIGDIIKPDCSETLAMGNSSVFIAPRGCGADVSFVIANDNIDIGDIHLDIPAVGKHHFTFANEDVISYEVSNPSGNNYIVRVSVKG